MQKVDKCLICGSSDFDSFLTCKDYTVSQNFFDITRCKSCEFKFTNPRPEDHELGSYYESEDYISHTNTKKGIVNNLYHVVRNYTLKQKLSLLDSYVSRGTILDYGCGTGMFLSVAKSYGWNCIGMEPGKTARQIAINQGVNVFENKEFVSQALQNKEVEAITLWHVLEHVTDMNQTLSFFKEALHKNGVLIIAVPNHVSFDAKYYREYWAAYDVPRHLYHFELSTIKKLVENSGFKLIETKPMKFDSFYVSMLSEKYKTGKVNLIKAFLVGLWSNIAAKGVNSYSSSIYVFKHA